MKEIVIDKRKDRVKIEEQMKVFFENGGMIEKLPYSEDIVDIILVKTQMRKINRERKARNK